DVFAGKKSAQIREILISESAWEEMTCLFAPSLIKIAVIRTFPAKILRFTDSLTVTDPVIPLVLRRV
ncbi:hypothetical protein CWN54_11455, partial [Klebsiella pneumoniae]